MAGGVWKEKAFVLDARWASGDSCGTSFSLSNFLSNNQAWPLASSLAALPEAPAATAAPAVPGVLVTFHL